MLADPNKSHADLFGMLLYAPARNQAQIQAKECSQPQARIGWSRKHDLFSRWCDA